jgi:Zn-dependent M16 (insulinase) family peptidase
MIKQVLEKVKVDGFDQSRIEAALHQMELGQKHVSKVYRPGNIQ